MAGLHRNLSVERTNSTPKGRGPPCSRSSGAACGDLPQPLAACPGAGTPAPFPKASPAGPGFPVLDWGQAETISASRDRESVMALKTDQLKGELTEKVVHQLHDRLSRDKAASAERFVRQFYANVPPDDILQ